MRADKEHLPTSKVKSFNDTLHYADSTSHDRLGITVRKADCEYKAPSRPIATVIHWSALSAIRCA